MFPKISRILTLLSLMMLIVPAYAAEVSNLYSAEVPVASQSPEDRSQAIAAALQQVLIKVTGNDAVTRHGISREMIKQSSSYVQQYRYRIAESQDDQGNPVEKRFVSVQFDALAINQQLRDAGLPVWGKARPQLIAWLGLTENGRRRLFSPELDAGLAASLYKMSAARGIPFLMPLMDLEDLGAISNSDLWGGFEQPLRDASARYLSDIVLAIRLDQSSADYWQASWTLLTASEQINWQTQGNSRQQVLADGINRMADQVAAAFAPSGGADLENITVQISNLNAFDRLAKVRKMLVGLETVKSLQIRHLQNDTVIMNIQLQGGRQSFEQAVLLSGMLDSVPVEMQIETFDMPAVIMQPAEPPADRPETTVAQPGQVEQPVASVLPQVQPEAPKIDLHYRVR